MGLSQHQPTGAQPNLSGESIGRQPDYFESLKARPWETPTALQRLIVPERLMPENCSVKTNWVVLTGASCAGKTTIVQVLEGMGYRVVHEKATAFVEEEMAKGRTFREIRADDNAFRREVFKRTLQEELDLLSDSHKIIFFDRAVVDCVSVNRISGSDPHEIVNKLEPYRYAATFVCNILPFVDNGIRTKNEERRHFMDAAFERDYAAMGYNPIRVPVFSGSIEESIAQRVEMILSTLRKIIPRSDVSAA